MTTIRTVLAGTHLQSFDDTGPGLKMEKNKKQFIISDLGI